MEVHLVVTKNEQGELVDNPFRNMYTVYAGGDDLLFAVENTGSGARSLGWDNFCLHQRTRRHPEV